ncbi:MAG: hypothetical protein ABH850_02105 [Candidatus Micrarchaeota archaeon]
MVEIVGTKRIGADSEDKRKLVIERIRRRAKQSTEKSRRKILELRGRYKLKVERNEEKMRKRKENRVKLGPTCVSLMNSREKEKQRRSAIGSLVPEKPKFSQAKEHAPRIYGKRFELIKKEQPIETD